jgi:hypothetical protein
MLVVSTAVSVFAQYRDDRDRDDRDRRSGACFFTEANFGGEKFCMREGERMAQVPDGFNDRISSIRIFGRTEITVYQNRDFGGPNLRLRDDVSNLQSYQISPGHSWNDRVSSIEISRGRGWDRDGGGDRDRDRDRDRDGDRDRDRDQYRDRDRSDAEWNRDGACFFKEADFRGDKFCVQRGDRVAQVPSGFGDQISSVRIFGRVTVTVYQDQNFGGPNLRLQQDVSNLQSYQVKPGHSWNDRISSIKVY